MLVVTVISRTNADAGKVCISVEEPTMPADVATRETVINLRASAAQRALIDKAAQLQGKSRTDFMLEASSDRAQQVLLDRTVFTLDAEHYQRFAKLLDAPVETNKALTQLLSKSAPWER
jgi:uncharacterized protein (DUF1778 family)